jgi:hypothetical protein
MSKPEVIKMHLDILFKSVTFLNKHKIEVMLQEYKHSKLQKQQEEVERQSIQNQMRKLRGRSTSKKDRKNTGEFSLNEVVGDTTTPDKSIFTAD